VYEQEFWYRSEVEQQQHLYCNKCSFCAIAAAVPPRPEDGKYDE